jgi:hypothetical protein
MGRLMSSNDSTAVYINARLQEFMRKPEWNRDPAAEQPVQ